MVERIVPGMMARSKAGHDKGCLYLILRVEDEYVYLTDGRRRPMAKPKKKKYRHIQIIKLMPENWNSEAVSDDYIRRALREYETESAQPKI